MAVPGPNQCFEPPVKWDDCDCEDDGGGDEIDDTAAADYYGCADDDDGDIYIMMKCLSVTKNHHFLLGVSCNHLNHP